MPSVKDFEKKQGSSKHHSKAGSAHKHQASTKTQKPRRRPGREHEEETPEVAVVDVHAEETPMSGADEATASMAESQGSTGTAAEESMDPQRTADFRQDHQNHQDQDKVELHFYGSEILRAKFPQAFKVAESVATEWKHDGNFEGLPLENPLAQYFAAKGLRKAKEVEKKVLESPLTEKMAMKALQAGLKAQGLVSQWREKSQKK
jgi:hypothetical protein